MKKNYRMTLIAVISAVVIGLGIMFFKLYIQLNQPVDFNQSLEEGISDEVLYESLPSVRKNLPRKTTETESLTDVTFDGKILTNKVMTEIDERVFKQKIDEVSMNVIKTACTSRLTRSVLMKRDLQVDYLFTNKDGKELAVISIFKKNCEE